MFTCESLVNILRCVNYYVTIVGSLAIKRFLWIISLVCYLLTLTALKYGRFREKIGILISLKISLVLIRYRLNRRKRILVQNSFFFFIKTRTNNFRSMIYINFRQNSFLFFFFLQVRITLHCRLTRF